MLEHCCGSFWPTLTPQTGTPHTGLLPLSLCSLNKDSGVINTCLLLRQQWYLLSYRAVKFLAWPSSATAALKPLPRQGAPCLWKVGLSVPLLLLQRGLLLPSGFMFHHKKTSKGDEEFQPSFLSAYWRNPDLCLGLKGVLNISFLHEEGGATGSVTTCSTTPRLWILHLTF